MEKLTKHTKSSLGLNILLRSPQSAQQSSRQAHCTGEHGIHGTDRTLDCGARVHGRTGSSRGGACGGGDVGRVRAIRWAGVQRRHARLIGDIGPVCSNGGAEGGGGDKVFDIEERPVCGAVAGGGCGHGVVCGLAEEVLDVPVRRAGDGGLGARVGNKGRGGVCKGARAGGVCGDEQVGLQPVQDLGRGGVRGRRRVGVDHDEDVALAGGIDGRGRWKGNGGLGVWDCGVVSGEPGKWTRVGGWRTANAIVDAGGLDVGAVLEDDRQLIRGGGQVEGCGRDLSQGGAGNKEGAGEDVGGEHDAGGVDDRRMRV